MGRGLTFNLSGVGRGGGGGGGGGLSGRIC